MKKLIFILFVIAGVCLQAQERLMPVMPENDSIFIESERPLMYHQFMMAPLIPNEMDFKLSGFQFDIPGEISKRWSLDQPERISFSAFESMFFTPYSGFQPSPFLREGVVLSGASYRLNNRFSMGGYSFGANSIFTAPLPGKGFNQYDVRGSTLFMQYNVSGKFKIETRVSVTQGPGF